MQEQQIADRAHAYVELGKTDEAIEILGTLERVGRNVEDKAAQLPCRLGLAEQLVVLLQ